MITRSFLMSKPDYSRDLPSATQGTNPARFRIYWDDPSRDYSVAMTELGRRTTATSAGQAER